MNSSELKDFWEFFNNVVKIPMCSQNEEQIREYAIEEVKKSKLKFEVDGTGNLLAERAWFFVINLVSSLNSLKFEVKKKKKLISDVFYDIVHIVGDCSLFNEFVFFFKPATCLDKF